jgi:hypothetical protein
LRDLAKEQKTSPKNLLKITNKLGIKAVSGPSIDGGRQYIFHRIAFDGIKCWPKVHKRKYKPRRFNCTQAAEYLGISMASVRAAVSRGYLSVQGSPGEGSRKKNSHFMFSKFELDRYRNRRSLGKRDVLSARQAAAALGEDLSWFYKKWVLTGRLKRVDYEDPLGTNFFLTADIRKIINMKSRTVTGPEAAKIIGVTRNTVFKWYRKGEIMPVSGPCVDGFGCNLYLRSDIMSIKKELQGAERDLRTAKHGQTTN